MSLIYLLLFFQQATDDKGLPQEGTRLLAEHCLDCHSGPKPKGGLDLSERKKAIHGGNKGLGLGPNLKKSPVLEMVQAGKMPPKKPLDLKSQKKFEQWILSGAAYSNDPIDPFQFTTSKRAGRDWWSLQPIAQVDLPRVKNPQWPLEPLDFFILAKLEQMGINPSVPAPREKVLRRAHIALTGLPPNPHEIMEFLKDQSPNAFAKKIDELLASPGYGEKWARHWLDIVRYGESDGFERNNPREFAWPYRDWLIDAFNRGLPYNEFCKLQIAGDALHPGDTHALMATGYLVAGIHNTVLGVMPETKEQARQDELEDLIGNLGQTFLGLTLNCARCHEHKFDPFSQNDYYKLTAIFGNFKPENKTLPDREKEALIANLQKELADSNNKLEVFAKKVATKSGKKQGSILPLPLASWDFTKGLKDQVGNLNVTLKGDAILNPQGLALNGKSGFAQTPPLNQPLGEKTLEAWVQLNSFEQQGGGVLTVQTLAGEVFDSIVFGEREKGKWMAGSNHFARTQSFSSPRENPMGLVQMAITWKTDGTIQGFQNGKPYGKKYVSKGLELFPEGKSLITFGIRHFPPGGNRMLEGVLARARVFDRALEESEIHALYENGAREIPESLYKQFLSLEEWKQWETIISNSNLLRAKLSQAQAKKGQNSYLPASTTPPTAFFLHRGQISEKGPVVPPASLTTLAMLPQWKLDEKTTDGNRRGNFAQWMVSKENPLLARVIVNRIWHYHFGTGIVDTPGDFGFNGGRPSHQELLDFLATQFQEHGFSLKWLHKTILLSRTYSQSAQARPEALAKDAGNRLLWRWQPRRLEAEILRDSLLQVAGKLDRQMGGPGISDYKTVFNNGTTFYDPVEPLQKQVFRRSIYRFIPRGANQGTFDCFDCPDNSAAAPRRTSTTTPQQALALWNGALVLNLSRDLELAWSGSKKSNQPEVIENQIRFLFQQVLLRQPEAEEKSQAIALVQNHGLATLARVLLNCNEFLTLD